MSSFAILELAGKNYCMLKSRFLTYYNFPTIPVKFPSLSRNNVQSRFIVVFAIRLRFSIVSSTRKVGAILGPM